MGLTLQELIKLDEETSTALGWNGGGRMDISCHNREDNDIWLYYDIHPSAMEKHNDVLDAFTSLQAQLKGIWRGRVQTIEFHDTDDDGNLSGYYVSIELAETVKEEE